MLKMKKITAILATTVVATTFLTACHDDAKTTAPQAQQQQQLPKDFNSQASYAVGYAAGQNFLVGMIESQKGMMDYNQTYILQGIKDALDNKPEMTDEQIQSTLRKLQNTLEAAQVKSVEDNNKKLMETFSKQEGVKKTASGILYRIVSEGEGAKILPTDTVKVEYTGKLGNGEVFDSSEKHGAVEFPLNQVIPGWTEALQLIKKGGEIQMVIPAKLAYGDNAMGPIPANSDLYFQVKVLDVTAEK
ncbi:FKBP-type peptidyl-prolyl cis-trans isomerase [Actinobacillus delphinicola]|uniref:Peptidyl-prolyl cis-trans isomerase n=1 Tax=Actinobacillus delphinicola TaxID=51161 RepID=A0A448TU02_9PAST|nr:FKBP-type peptidyl-prolyl cis-trans isomerase [Actinobacillus delphinicola]VEJ09311.1 FKBP-type peptidylprolyl isomerase [Actinobacillus delphinicola]